MKLNSSRGGRNLAQSDGKIFDFEQQIIWPRLLLRERKSR